MKLPLCALLLVVTGCASVETRSRFEQPTWPRTSVSEAMPSSATQSSLGSDPTHAFQTESKSQRPQWREGQVLMQGFIGASLYDDVSIDGGNGGDIDGDSGDLDQLPLIGGGAQFKLGGERVDYGLEAFFSFEGRANTTAFTTSGGGLVIAGTVDLLIVDIYGGPFVSTFLGDKIRVYAGAGPLMQFADYSQDFSSIDESGSGFGVGGYVRTGFEFLLPGRTLIGLGVRWSDSTIDLDNGLGDLDVEGFQAFLTVSTGI